MTRCQWRRCDERATETYTVTAPGYRWNRALYAPGETIRLCVLHGAALRECDDDYMLPEGCGPLPNALRLPFDYVTRARARR